MSSSVNVMTARIENVASFPRYFQIVFENVLYVFYMYAKNSYVILVMVQYANSFNDLKYKITVTSACNVYVSVNARRYTNLL